jgi:hypothetical protein
VVDFVTEKAAASEAVPAKANPREKNPKKKKKNLTPEGVNYRSELRKLVAAGETHNLGGDQDV